MFVCSNQSDLSQIKIEWHQTSPTLGVTPRCDDVDCASNQYNVVNTFACERIRLRRSHNFFRSNSICATRAAKRFFPPAINYDGMLMVGVCVCVYARINKHALCTHTCYVLLTHTPTQIFIKLCSRCYVVRTQSDGVCVTI